MFVSPSNFSAAVAYCSKELFRNGGSSLLGHVVGQQCPGIVSARMTRRHYWNTVAQ